MRSSRAKSLVAFVMIITMVALPLVTVCQSANQTEPVTATSLTDSDLADPYEVNTQSSADSQTQQPSAILSQPTYSPLLGGTDSDNDSLSDAQESLLGTNPLLADSDSDGLNDGSEVNVYKTNPLISDTDSDNLTDGLETMGWSIVVDNKTVIVTSNPRLVDSDNDSLNDTTEFYIYKTNPDNADTDSDGLPDKWEVTHSFSPTNSFDARQDPDLDGLTNLDEYKLGTILTDGKLSFEKDLFIEVDYMSGYEPSPAALTYLKSYFKEVGIRVHIDVDDCISNDELAAIGVTPNELDNQECSLIENKFHDFHSTHVYVFYAKSLEGASTRGRASGYGAFLSVEKIRGLEGVRVLWLTDRTRAEKVVLLHEIGHTINVITRDQNGNEQYCDNLGCVMSGVNSWDDLPGIVNEAVALHSDNPQYCDKDRALIDLTNKWSVDESWIQLESKYIPLNNTG